MEEVVISLGRKEAEDIIREMKKIEITCPYCLKKYSFEADDVKRMFDNAAKNIQRE